MHHPLLVPPQLRRVIAVHHDVNARSLLLAAIDEALERRFDKALCSFIVHRVLQPVRLHVDAVLAGYCPQHVLGVELHQVLLLVGQLATAHRHQDERLLVVQHAEAHIGVLGAAWLRSEPADIVTAPIHLNLVPWLTRFLQDAAARGQVVFLDELEYGVVLPIRSNNGAVPGEDVVVAGDTGVGVHKVAARWPSEHLRDVGELQALFGEVQVVHRPGQRHLGVERMHLLHGRVVHRLAVHQRYVQAVVAVEP
mmetsp:Transcript_18113/g.46383  ORF Transcript_18113/g.46383 Transcript_18113/m.46383 type:complete len:252 (-) Transcript_18113:385-1140(-)